ncbi:SDR family NAD(P)-dependent oxidoreductase [Rhizobium leguminosarum]|jgi:3-oxoacyl-[acyl-carrier protein] reductase|uniref:3-oxoacyl-ACP reductase n=2 Tax=Rhizobium leguminosarum TaxID=384 RepID=A0A1B8R7U9_RHILT|nr:MULTISPECIES: SDR family NAD(P)-dependent oxidoreductase [Rhizobium]MDH6658053.1 NAD(P)-dependent dehydrogenase (short-subunit alcohol dehydrogenase family) [Rhizobium sophorae]AOO92374.1 3-oxoacyl-ACP reductase [Rhizobium leguminosarum bv. trifolii]ASS57159.1 NAD(P)-dependent oxidoreductase [Rhizobium leguminosarum bv. viciae]AVC50080.1 enoyl-(Acyl carrier) reductase family protein [Rhizobium leguminosarum bv. viciae]MBA8830966.1 3-oxoacyl-[acyl-carrier protein] reductase [Rhizobium legumi
MNMIDLKERIIVITGGARGIGYAIAERVIQSGGKVAIWDLNENMAKDSASALGSGTVAFGVNVADPVSVKNAAAATEEIFGRIDGLVNSAGITGPVKPTIEYDFGEWKDVVDVCLTGTFNCCRHVVPVMLKRDYGRIVNISSVAGKEGNPNIAAYSAAKAGVLGFTKSLGKELAKTGIAVNAVTPTTAKTPILDGLTSEFIEYMRVRIPRDRFVELHEIASMVVWLLSEENSFTTASTFDLSGGRTTY